MMPISYPMGPQGSTPGHMDLEARYRQIEAARSTPQSYQSPYTDKMLGALWGHFPQPQAMHSQGPRMTLQELLMGQQ